MAVFFTNHDVETRSHQEVPFEFVWDHYLKSNFVYPRKLELLAPVLPRINAGWPKLLSGPSDLFQLHMAWENENDVGSSVAAFRDTAETFVIQHAASESQPLLMIECLQSVTKSMSADVNVKFGCMYFRPDNLWPVTLCKAISKTHPEELIDLTTKEYLYCNPMVAGNDPVRSELPIGLIKELTESDPSLLSLAGSVLGPLRARATGFAGIEATFPNLQARYADNGIIRERKILGLFQEGTLAGIGLCYASDFPMNLSFLDSRVEILVSPDVVDRSSVVVDLCRAAIHNAHKRGEGFCVLLVDSADKDAAIAGGFTPTGKQYSSFLWGREEDRGYAASSLALDNMYSRYRTSQSK